MTTKRQHELRACAAFCFWGITQVAGRHGSLPLHVDRAFIGKKLPEINRNYSLKQDYIILGNDIAEGTESACKASNHKAQGSALGSAAQEENTPCMGKTIMKGAALTGRRISRVTPPRALPWARRCGPCGANCAICFIIPLVFGITGVAGRHGGLPLHVGIGM